ncbi:hypothetical protein [Piscirickettsia litoralis]|uniref:Uncharacterized protein n=1 Tax=Piscirickettsia litoralis TaxID=1891921 RepID=A0ABX3A4J0_9GAMM|nr:hypothetical protein [Piscirickettsia litoralis]ODN42563.1 hypothetical protein BGC07_05995 [Piscirickettsia litoralis]
MSYINNQSLTIDVTCYDNNFAEIGQFSIGNAYIESVDYHRYQYGVSGRVVFYESHLKESDDDVEEQYLSKASLIKLVVKASNSMAIDKSGQEYELLMTVYSQCPPKAIYSINYINNYSNKKITIDFYDPLKVLLSTFLCFDVFSGASYQDIFSKYINLLDPNKNLLS